MEMFPWNLTCPLGFEEGERDVAGACQSRFARENPPMSASDMSLQVEGESGSWKEVRM